MAHRRQAAAKAAATIIAAAAASVGVAVGTARGRQEVEEAAAHMEAVMAANRDAMAAAAAVARPARPLERIQHLDRSKINNLALLTAILK